MGLRGRSQFLDKNCFFLTTTCYQWYKLLELDACKELFIKSVVSLNDKYKSEILGYVIMPNHIQFYIVL